MNPKPVLTKSTEMSKHMSLQEKCNYLTQRLSIDNWKNCIQDHQSSTLLETQIISILSPNVTKALPDGWQNISTVTAAQTWIEERDQESHCLAVQLLNTHEIIGFIFLYETAIEASSTSMDLRFGYLLSESVWGKGLGTELIEGLLLWCQSEGNITSIAGGVEKDNIGSIKVLEKTGFTLSPDEDTSSDVLFYSYYF